MILPHWCEQVAARCPRKGQHPSLREGHMSTSQTAHFLTGPFRYIYPTLATRNTTSVPPMSLLSLLRRPATAQNCTFDIIFVCLFAPWSPKAGCRMPPAAGRQERRRPPTRRARGCWRRCRSSWLTAQLVTALRYDTRLAWVEGRSRRVLLRLLACISMLNQRFQTSAKFNAGSVAFFFARPSVRPPDRASRLQSISFIIRTK